MGIYWIQMQGDSTLIIKQANREFSLKEIALLSYRTIVQKLIKSLSFNQFEHVSQVHHRT